VVSLPAVLTPTRPIDKRPTQNVVNNSPQPAKIAAPTTTGRNIGRAPFESVTATVLYGTSGFPSELFVTSIWVQTPPLWAMKRRDPTPIAETAAAKLGLFALAVQLNVVPAVLRAAQKTALVFAKP